MPINDRHAEYNIWSPIWKRTRDGIAGQDAIKSGSTVYLPRLNGQSQQGYDSYLKRAQYINFAGRILNLSISQIFRKDPVIENVDESWIDNIDMNGMPFVYWSRLACEELMSVNRVGILVDYSDQKRPYLTMYKAENIINWQTDIIQGKSKLTMIVIEGETQRPKENDKYSLESTKIWRELILENGIYIVREWEKVSDKFELINEFTPLLNGDPFDYIPLFILTMNGNSIQISNAPMKGIIDINLAHYINSADYENMIHWTGARTVIITGWDETKDFPIGGCAVLTEGGTASFLEASANSALEMAMRHKEEQLAMLGNTLISGKGRYVASAETASKTSAGEYACLADISNVMDSVMTAVLSLMVQWAGGNPDDVKIEYNTEFEEIEIIPNDITPLMGAVQSGMISWDAFFYNLKKKNFYAPDVTMEDEKKLIEQDNADRLKKRDDAMMGLYKQVEDKNALSPDKNADKNNMDKSNA